MTRMFRCAYGGLAAAVLLLLGCADEGTVTGGGNRSPNPVYGYVAGGGAGTAVDLYRIDLDYDERNGYYFWEKIDSTETDEDGYFGFDTLSEIPYAVAVLADAGDCGGFAGYYDGTRLEADTLRIPDLVLTRTAEVEGALVFTDEVVNKRIIVGTDTLYPFDSISVSMNLVGTPFDAVVADDGSFAFYSVPPGTYKLRIRYNSREIVVDNSLLGFYVVHYTTLPVHSADTVTYAGEPYVLADSLTVAGDSVTVVSRMYQLRCRVIME